jgi:hypothetical protein
MLPDRHRFPRTAALLAAVTVFAALTASVSLPDLSAAGGLPDRISDAEFWKLSTDMSERSGYFQFENFLSNELTLQDVIPALEAKTERGGAYIGVGPEQNFTYIAALRPKIAFIIDIRRQNLVEHLMYKGLFDLSADRADFISRLFSRKRPAGVGTRSTATALFLAYEREPGDAALFAANLQALLDDLTRRHALPLDADDLRDVKYVYETFFKSGPQINYAVGGGPFSMPTYTELMTRGDDTGLNRSYLATEQNYRIVKKLEGDNLVIPVVGDFAGSKAVREVGRYLAAHHSTVTAFYLSNVERYLFDGQNAWRRFYVNVAVLPYDRKSLFIRAVLNGPELQSFSLLCPIDVLMRAFGEGQIGSYEDVIALSNDR